MTALRIGLIGCGHMGGIVHLNILRRLPLVELVALAEPDAQRREAAKRQAPRATTFADYHELLDSPEIDAVIVCLPNALHTEAGIAALERGKHIYLEKPLAVNLDSGRSLLEVAEQSGKVAMIGFCYRFNPLHLEVRRVLNEGLLGEIIGARSVFTSAPDRAPEWKHTRKSGGGALLDLASHHIDLVRFWFNKEIVEVRASVTSKRAEADSATLELRLADDVLVQSFFSTSSVNEDRFEIYGRAGKLSLDRYNSWSVEFTGGMHSPMARRRFEEVLSWIPRSRFAINKVIAPAREPCLSAAVEHFVEAVRNGEQASPNFEDGFHSLAVVIAAEESARRGCPVSPLRE